MSVNVHPKTTTLQQSFIKNFKYRKKEKRGKKLAHVPEDMSQI